MLDEDESFSLTANITNPGPQSVVLTGFIREQRPDGTYIAPLLPQLFFGQDGTPLSTWRQDISGTGEQTILSRSGGLPTLPREEMYWRKVSDTAVTPAAPPGVEAAAVSLAPLFLALVVAGVILWAVSPKRG